MTAEPWTLSDLPPVQLVEPPDVAESFRTGPAEEPGPELPPSLRDVSLRVWAEAEAAGDPEWRSALPEERAAHVADRILHVVGAAESLARAGYTGPGALARYLADMAALADPAAPFRAPPAEDDAPAWRTLADVPDDPPAPLLLGMLEPQGPTLAYAAPGVGKGTSGAWIITQAQGLGMLPMVFDAERRPREWARRVSGLGGDRSRVVYVTPEDLGPSMAGRPFWEQAEAVGRIVAAAGGDLFILDSLLPASGIGEDRLRSDAQAPFLFVSALDRLGVPTLAFGHPPKGQPEGDPFGSMAWLAAFRLTWLGTRAEGDGHRIRWRPKKRNERGHIPGVLLTVTYGDDGRPCQVDRADDEESTRDWILGALVSGPRSLADLAEDMLAETEGAPAGESDRIRERLGRALQRMRHEGWVEKLGKGGRGVTWQLRVRP